MTMPETNRVDPRFFDNGKFKKESVIEKKCDFVLILLVNDTQSRLYHGFHSQNFNKIRDLFKVMLQTIRS